MQSNGQRKRAGAHRTSALHDAVWRLPARATSHTVHK